MEEVKGEAFMRATLTCSFLVILEIVLMKLIQAFVVGQECASGSGGALLCE